MSGESGTPIGVGRSVGTIGPVESGVSGESGTTIGVGRSIGTTGGPVESGMS